MRSRPRSSGPGEPGCVSRWTTRAPASARCDTSWRPARTSSSRTGRSWTVSASDQVLATLVGAVVTFARGSGAAVVAEGIETAADARTCRRLRAEARAGSALRPPGAPGGVGAAASGRARQDRPLGEQRRLGGRRALAVSAHRRRMMIPSNSGEEMTAMKASEGDRLVLASSVVDGAVRDGTIVAVRGPDGTPPYMVRWHDTGEESMVFPGPDAHVEHGGARGHVGATSSAGVTWRVQVTLGHEGPETTAQAVLVAGQPDHLDAVGRARRNPEDEPDMIVGDEVAVARALRRLADRLIDSAEDEIGEHTGSSAHVHG